MPANILNLLDFKVQLVEEAKLRHPQYPQQHHHRQIPRRTHGQRCCGEGSEVAARAQPE
jgi:hypothetical protein